MKEKPKNIGLLETLQRIKQAGLSSAHLRSGMRPQDRTLPDLGERVRLIEDYLGRWRKDVFQKGMLFFVLYDIEDHKVRRHIAKFLQREGCTRVQKSVFLGNTDHKTYKHIADTLREVNAMYQNGDSIMVLPVSRESMAQLDVIGKNVDYRMTVSPPNVLII